MAGERDREREGRMARESSIFTTNHSQTGPCPWDWVHMPWHGLDALEGKGGKWRVTI